MADDTHDRASKRHPGKTAQARKLRRNETDAEYRLWYELRNRQLSRFKFSRQIPLGPYIADFVCRERMLVIEVDGSQHAASEQDRHRTRWLNGQGYSVLRFWNHEVLEDCSSTVETILAVLREKSFAPDHPDRFSPSAAHGNAQQ